MSITATPPPVTLREIDRADADVVARILYAAFAGIHDRHVFPRDFPTLEAAQQLVTGFTGHPHIWGVVAEIDGRVVGSNFLDERGAVRGIGPITVDPEVQSSGVGRRLMQAVIDRGAGAHGVRLLQDAFNTRSMALYTALGFGTREPIAVIGGRLRPGVAPALEVRPLEEADLEAAGALHRRVHGFERARELRESLTSPVLDPFVAIRDGRIVAYVTGAGFFAAAHGAGETQADLLAAIIGALAATGGEASLLLPTRQDELFRGLLAAGLRVVKPMTYMTLEEFRAPAGAWFPTVLY